MWSQHQKPTVQVLHYVEKERPREHRIEQVHSDCLIRQETVQICIAELQEERIEQEDHKTSFED